MNKQELIESIAHLPSDCSRPRPMIDKITVLELIKLLDEPQKVTVPQLVADWYEEHKENFDSKLWVEIYKFGTFEKSEFAKWVYKTKNSISTIVNMHQFGYTVEKEPKYTVKIKSVNQYLVRNTDEDFLGFFTK